MILGVRGRHVTTIVMVDLVLRGTARLVSNRGVVLDGGRGASWVTGSIVFVSPSSGVSSVGPAILQRTGCFRRASSIVFLCFPLRSHGICLGRISPGNLGRRQWFCTTGSILPRCLCIVLRRQAPSHILPCFVFFRARYVRGPGYGLVCGRLSFGGGWC